MKKIIIVLLLALFSGSACLCAQDLTAAANYQRFAKANSTVSPRVVFIGNSITEGWAGARPEFFTNNGFVGRGIGGQTSPQLLLRFRQDVINLHPLAVVINIGTNDIAQNTGEYSPQYTLDCINSMAELAYSNGIKVILSSVTPAKEYPWRKEIKDVPATIDALNAKIKALADSKGYWYLDYNTLLRDANGGMIKEYTFDEVHVTMPGYAIMEKAALELIEKVLPPSPSTDFFPSQKFEGLAKTPQMGWNSWNLFQTNINEQLVKEIADIFVSRGLKDAGYEYILLDDGWMDMKRDVQGNLVPHPDKFPNGIKVVADYVHSKGLKFGLYNCAGDKTCAGYPGSRGHEYQDAMKYAEWGVDYLKYDWCNTGDMNAKEAYTTMRNALFAAGRPILFSICEWGDNNPWEWASPIGHSWRTTGDISGCFDCKEEHQTPFNTWYSWGVVQIMNMRDQAALRKVAGPDHWNDMDMMEIGNGGMNHIEEASHFALWAILNSPLLLGNDLRTMSQETFDVISNKEIIAINQDALGIQAFKYTTLGNVEVWVKPLENDAWAIAFFNHSKEATDFSFDWTGKTIEDKDFNKQISFTKDKEYKLRDLSAKKEMGTTKKALKTRLEANQTVVVKISD